MWAALCRADWEAERLAARLIRALAEPFPLGERELQIGGIGISLAPAASDVGAVLNTDVLLRQADIALYRAKEAGRVTHCFFETTTAPGPMVASNGLAVRAEEQQGEIVG